MQQHEQNLENERLKNKEKISIERPHFNKMGENIAKQSNQRRKEFYDNAVAEYHHDQKEDEKIPKKKAEGLEALFKNAVKKRSEKDVFGLLDTERDKKQLKEGMNALQNNVRNQRMQRAKAKDEQNKIDAFNLEKNKKQLSQGLQALSTKTRVRFA